MIGRPLQHLYQKEQAEIGDVMLDVQNLTRKGVFEDISFTVRKGEVVGFFGLVGAGRSEIMRAIFGVDKYQGGQVLSGRQAPPGRAIPPPPSPPASASAPRTGRKRALP